MGGGERIGNAPGNIASGSGEDRAAKYKIGALTVDRNSKRKIKIGLLWHSANSGNLGVGALTIANMAIVRQVAFDLGFEPEFCIIGMRDAGPRYVSEDEAEVFVVDGKALLSPSGCWRIIAQQDCVLDIGAGDSFAEIYGFKRFFFLWWTKMIAHVRRVPLLLSPQTIGPFTRSPYTQLASLALTRARAVLARDPQSLEALARIAPGAKGELAVDVAFALPYVDRGGERSDVRARVGVNVSGLLFHEAESGRNRFGLDVDYAQLMRRFIADLTERPDIEIHLIAHAIDASGGCEPAVDDDDRVADQLAQEFPTATRVPSFLGPSEAKSYISSLDFLVAGRMHACIAAFSAGVPVVPVAYSRKFSGLFGMLGYDRMVPVKGLDTQQAAEFLHDCLDRKAELGREMKLGMMQVEALLGVYRSELRALLISLKVER
ncbi:polysaccharide pyruvyl transferase family protein [Phenylobacterium sp.]|uniref:polysaccharide pyruvyl transferase family protein n=2 Tax=Phenylobacterium sp. TaxID=1871053 RepID=UPI002736C561|nr:polysaccharide pyruvyl transferase family protein [Phenylobacterium sp.]MDP3594714.1 polysaccharide pyruvyl transferase family protein [Phenylobacterium sp.]